MNESRADSPPGRRLDLAQWVDEVCARFEAAWQSGGRPRVEDYLGAVAEPQRTDLLHELILLEVEYARRQGQAPRPDDYLSRFPGLDSQWLASAIGSADSRAGSGGDVTQPASGSRLTSRRIPSDRLERYY